MNKIFIVSGPTCSGKDTIIDLVLDRNRSWQRLTTMTSRPKSSIEDQRSYRFVSNKQFEKMISQEKMFEWAKVHDYYYGNSKEYLDKVLDQNEPAVGDVDIKGAKTYKEKLGGRVVLVFLKAKNLAVLEKRIKKRDRGESEKEIKKRLLRAKEELAHEQYFQYSITNKEGEEEEAAEELEDVIKAEIEK
jgi:guanylate kinase